MNEDINDVCDLLGEMRDHPFEDMRSNLRGLHARLEAMGESVDDLAELEKSIQDRPELIIPQSQEDRKQREEVLIEFTKIVDESYLSSSWALLETMRHLQDVYVGESEVAERLIQEYQDESRVVLGMRVYSHHGNTLPVRLNSSAKGEHFSDSEGSHERFLVNVDDIREKFGDDYRRGADYHYGELDAHSIHVLGLLENHYDEVQRIADQFIGLIGDQNSEWREEYYDMGECFLELIDEGAHNNYE